MGKSELVDLRMCLHAETDAAIRVSDDGFDTHAKWLPKSQIEWEMKNVKTQTIVVTMPQWLAENKRLV